MFQQVICILYQEDTVCLQKRSNIFSSFPHCRQITCCLKKEARLRGVRLNFLVSKPIKKGSAIIGRPATARDRKNRKVRKKRVALGSMPYL